MNRSFPRRSPDHGITGVDTTNLGKLDKQTAQDIISHVDDKLPPDMADWLLETQFMSEDSLAVKLGSTATSTGALAVASVVNQTVIKEWPELKSGVELPHVLDVFTNILAQASPGSFVADSPELLQHTPGMLMVAAVGNIAGRGLNYSRKQRFNTRAAAAQHKLAVRVQAGTMRWDLRDVDDPSVAYVGHGSEILDTILDSSDHQVVQVAYGSRDRLFVTLPEDGNYNDDVQAVRAADAVHAGQILIFPGTETDNLFAPVDDENSFDIGVARAGSFIRRIDDACLDRGVPFIPVVIIGSKLQPIDHIKLSAEDDPGLSRHDTMTTYMAELADARQQEITVIDITDTVMDEVLIRAGNRPIHLDATPKSAAAFRDAFFERTRLQLDIDPRAEPLDVVVNLSDRATENQPIERKADTIVILTDPSRKPSTFRNAQSADHQHPGDRLGSDDILVVPDLIHRKLEPYLHD